jgi:hypothetical protein
MVIVLCRVTLPEGERDRYREREREKERDVMSAWLDVTIALSGGNKTQGIKQHQASRAQQRNEAL